MHVTATELRRNIYQLLDEVLETGTPLEVTRKGRVLRVVPAEPVPKLERLPERRRAIRGARRTCHVRRSVARARQRRRWTFFSSPLQSRPTRRNMASTWRR